MRSASTREQGGPASLTLDRSTPALAHTKPWRVSVMSRLAAAAEDPHRFGQDQGLVATAGRRVHRDQPALGLGDDFLGHDHDVAVFQVGPRRIGAANEVSQLVPGPDLGQCPPPGSGDDHRAVFSGANGPGQQRALLSSTARARAAASAGPT